MITVYVAHEYGGNPANRAAAAKWCAFFARLGYCPIAMWIVLTGEWDESMRGHGLAIDKELIERSDVVLLVGPAGSSGMETEACHAESCGVPVLTLMASCGEFPARPEMLTDAQKLELVRRINSMVGVR